MFQFIQDRCEALANNFKEIDDIVTKKEKEVMTV